MQPVGGAPPPPSTGADYDVFSYLTPDQAQALAGASVTPDKQELLKQQLAQAEALKKGSGQHYTTGLGAAAGGLGDVLSSAVGNIEAKRLRGQQQDLVGQTQKGLGGYYDALRQMALAQALRGAPAATPQPDEGGGDTTPIPYG